MKKIFSSIMTLTIAITMASCGGNAKNGVREAQELSGAGATFPLPFYNVVFENFAQVNGDIVAYGGVGSGGGVRNLRDKVVDFAGSDAFLTDKEMAEMAPVVHIPTCMGAVVVAYNLDGVKELKLTGEVVADIFAGKIKMWNDERLTALNPDVTLPAEVIIPVFRSDGSGTTFIFTDYLTKVSPMWKEKFGAGKSVNFPSGQAAKGNLLHSLFTARCTFRGRVFQWDKGCIGVKYRNRLVGGYSVNYIWTVGLLHFTANPYGT